MKKNLVKSIIYFYHARFKCSVTKLEVHKLLLTIFNPRMLNKQMYQLGIFNKSKSNGKYNS